MTAPLIQRGLWRDNPVLVQGLGLCPALAVTDTFAKGLGLALTTLPVLVICGLASSVLPRAWPRALRLGALVLLAATLASAERFMVEAFAYPLSQALGIFVPLMAVNAIVLFRARDCGFHEPPGKALADALGMALGFVLVLLLVGGCRELIGHGTLFAGMAMLKGGVAGHEGLRLVTGEAPALIVALPPGAFIFMGLLMALKNRFSAPPATTATGKPMSAADVRARRVRVH